jgi:hypothetical protein
MSKRQMEVYAESTVDQEIQGALLVVDSEVRHSSLGLSGEAGERMAELIRTFISVYEAHGLPPKVLYYTFSELRVMIFCTRRTAVAVLLHLDADLLEVEKEAKKLAATAHLRSRAEPGNRIMRVLLSEPVRVAEAEQSITYTTTTMGVPSLELAERVDLQQQVDLPVRDYLEPMPEMPVSSVPTGPLMRVTWKDYIGSLELIVSKVMSHAVAERLIQQELTERQLSPHDRCYPESLRSVGERILQRVPHRRLRANLQQELERLVGSLGN